MQEPVDIHEITSVHESALDTDTFQTVSKKEQTSIDKPDSIPIPSTEKVLTVQNDEVIIYKIHL